MGAGESVTGRTRVTREIASSALENAFSDGAESVTIHELIQAGKQPEPELDNEDDAAAVAPHHEGLSWTEALTDKGISRFEMADKIKAIFEAMDEDDDHLITKREFTRALVETGHSQTDALTLFKEIDNTGSGKLSFAKFQAYQRVHVINLVRDAFKDADMERDRQLSKREFFTFFLGQGLTKQSCADFWDKIDVNGNKKVNFVEFRDWATEAVQEEAINSWQTLDA
eukprot:TRINITY_DN14398_c0_g2_i1.p1 TRINITY_DN14398_c0_g2~~TRINITY_DN14398_c0_g2_i1.p1  ORF type:complete len:244 (+),score=46.52 TRINITY_DN14398_c0_g2_i1:54-734(+)